MKSIEQMRDELITYYLENSVDMSDDGDGSVLEYEGVDTEIITEGLKMASTERIVDEYKKLFMWSIDK